jgi:GTP-binding protein
MTHHEDKKIRNIAIIAHVDHGKTTLIDQLLKQSGTFESHKAIVTRVMDSNDLEKERGITILAKNTAIKWGEYHINIIDTPGHADFGGEVERVLRMVDSVLLLVDSVEGPMPQTRFVTQKAFEQGLNPIVVVNKMDRPEARPDWVISEVFDLFDKLGATDEQLDFPILYASAANGSSGLEADDIKDNMQPLFESIVKYTPPPKVRDGEGFLMQVCALDYTTFLGALAIGKILRGSIKANSPISVINAAGKSKPGRILQIFSYQGLNRVEKQEAGAGEIVCLAGLERPFISDTLCSPEHEEKLSVLKVDEPTVQMLLQVNDSPFAGKEGKFVTSRHIRERLEKELIYNVSLKVEDTSEPDKFKICGRGELHLSILLENMRREGYEMAVAKPSVIVKEIDGVRCEPYENLTVDLEEIHQGPIIEYLNTNSGELLNMISDNRGRMRLDYNIPSRSLIGFRQTFLTLTQGSGLYSHIFDAYKPMKTTSAPQRRNGVLVSKTTGKATGYSLFNLQARGSMIIDPGTELYEGLIIGINNRRDDLIVNASKGKQLTNVRASGSDENIILTPPIRMSLEQAIDFINEDELVELTPASIRIRKKTLKETDRSKRS